jgi:lipoyl(octanoyl) transferase
LQEFDIKGERREGRVGIWVKTHHPSSRGTDTLSRGEREAKALPEQGEGEMFVDKKIAAIGVRIRHWVTYHGISINLNPDLTHFSGIVPCGISDAGVTSFEDLGIQATMEELDEALKKNFTQIFD